METKSSWKKSSDTGKSALQWKRDNNFAIVTMKRNCEPGAVEIIGLSRGANGAFKELQAKYEGKAPQTSAPYL